MRLFSKNHFPFHKQKAKKVFVRINSKTQIYTQIRRVHAYIKWRIWLYYEQFQSFKALKFLHPLGEKKRAQKHPLDPFVYRIFGPFREINFTDSGIFLIVEQFLSDVFLSFIKLLFNEKPAVIGCRF